MKTRKIVILFVLLFSLTFASCLTKVSEKDFGISFNNDTVAYDGSEHELLVTGDLLEGYEINYVNNGCSEIGVHKVTAEVINVETERVEKTYSAYLTIEGEIESQYYLYDGEVHSVEINGPVANGFEVVHENNNQTEAGKYYVTSKLVNKNTQEVIDEYYSILEIDNPQNEEFEAYMDEFLILLLEGDQRSVNFLFNNPENYGLSHYEAKLPEFSLDYSYEEDQAELEAIIAELHQFENARLSNEERETYEIVDRYLNYIYSYTDNMNYMTNSYLGTYLGYQSNLPLELAEYDFRNEQDVKDFIAYLVHAEEAFKTYLEFAQEQARRGYPMTDLVIDNVIAQCEEFVAMGEENFLIGIFNEKVDAVEFEFVDNTIEEYKALAKDAIMGSFTNAYQYLADNLPSLKGNATDAKGLAMYGEEGVEYYLLEMGHVLGFNEIDGDRLFEFVLDKFDEVNAKFDTVISKMQALSDKEYSSFYYAVINGTPQFAELTFDEIVAYFQEASKNFVPELNVMPEISIKNVPDSLTESFSPAAYFVSPIDETKYESIYLNQAYTTDYNYIFTTLAHEGYPGHLYQNVYAKSLDINDVRKIIKCSGYQEGWATYVEMESYYYSPVYQKTPGLRLALDYLSLDNQYSLIINALFDLAIHYKGMNPDELAAFFSELLGSEYTAADFIDAYNQLCEIPTNMSMYAISFLIFDELRTSAEKTLGEHFDIIEFNKVILDCGSCPLEMVIEKVQEYISDSKFINQIK